MLGSYLTTQSLEEPFNFLLKLLFLRENLFVFSKAHYQMFYSVNYLQKDALEKTWWHFECCFSQHKFLHSKFHNFCNLWNFCANYFKKCNAKIYNFLISESISAVLLCCIPSTPSSKQSEIHYLYLNLCTINTRNIHIKLN